MRSILWALCTCKLNSFVRNNGWKDCVDRIFNATTTYAIKEHGVTAFGLIGFCWGTYMNVKAKLEATNNDMFKCLIAFHPSIDQMSGWFKEDHLAMMRSIHCPQLFTACPTDGKI
jgi:dienelactone hydrolase